MEVLSTVLPGDSRPLQCPGCPDDALDLSQSLFNYFDSLDKGVLYGSWDFTGRKRAEDDDEDA